MPTQRKPAKRGPKPLPKHLKRVRVVSYLRPAAAMHLRNYVRNLKASGIDL